MGATRFCTVFFVLLSGISAISLCREADAQEYLIEENVAIARHDKRQTDIRFNRANARPVPERWGRLYQPDAEGDGGEQDLVSYRELPRCEGATVSLQEVYRHTPLTDQFDAVFYAKDDSEQAAKAARSPVRAVAYEAALLRNRRTGDTDLWQTLARLINIECLPTRFHFTFIGSRRYMEYRTGALAWSE